ncbi:hypothetical protein D039_1605B, partial [Vibrio parahaemolyticus EKP-028]|jgi:hypothetical protein
LHG